VIFFRAFFRALFLPETLNKLIQRIPRICQAIIKAHGDYFEKSKIWQKH